MKNPKEKAMELVWKYLPILESWKEDNSNKAKEYAIITVNFALENPLNTKGYNEYLLEVKQEIEKL